MSAPEWPGLPENKPRHGASPGAGSRAPVIHSYAAVTEERVPVRNPGRVPPPLAGVVSTGEMRVAALFFSVLLALRLACVFSLRFDSDEPQHLHMVWAWLHGLLPYRDVFDNHTPLFHLLCAPLLALLGERPEALLWVRLPMVALYAASLWLIFKLGSALFSPRAGLWAAVLAGAWPDFFFTMGEFRPDGLWTVLWLLALLVFTRTELDWKGTLLGGALLGGALAVSVKTFLLVAALAGAASVVVALRTVSGERSRDVSRRALAAVAGFALAPLAVAVFFAARHALPEFYQCVIAHNFMIAPTDRPRMSGRLLLVACVLCGLVAVGSALFGGDCGKGSRGSRRLLLLLAAGFYFAVSRGFQPTHSRQDNLPFIPLVGVFLAPVILFAAGRIARECRTWLPAAVGALEICAILVAHAPWRMETGDDLAMVADVLRLTPPSGFVMDVKGETLFRRRPVYAAFEPITMDRIQLGLLKDHVAKSLVATATPVVVNGDRLPPAARQFVEANYVRVAPRISVLGKRLCSYRRSGAAMDFVVAIPARYFIAGRGAPAAGLLDGTRLDGPRLLAAGPHAFVRTSGADDLDLVWADAVEKGFSPVW